MTALEFSLADRDFYAPLAGAARPEEGYRPSQAAPGWQATESGSWTQWHRGSPLGWAQQGWKVHVSARPGRQQHVLDTAAGICFGQGVPFKHLSAPLFYWWANHKYAPRSQGGKFITAYPGDVPAARRLMEALRAALDGEDGPYILSDRRFADSRTVHYRYGGFRSPERVQADGTRALLLRDGTGRLVPDRRGVSFWLPEGVTDPFAEPPAADATGPGPAPGLGGFVIESAIQHRNFGGTYRARDAVTGRAVFIKEARPHTGLGEITVAAPEQLRAEWAILTELHAAVPGVAPEPVSYFREWEHEFLVTELLPGVPLTRWAAAQHPLLSAGHTPDDFARYYHRCAKILAALDRDLDRLHEAGYLFIDISPTNMLVGPDDAVRLTDFGATHRRGAAFTLTGTPGYTPPARLVGGDLAVHDEYGMSGLAQFLLGPLHQVVEREPDALRHLYRDLGEPAPVPPALWARATRFHQPGDHPRLPGPEEVAADPARHLANLRDAAADALVAMADPDHADRVFPTIVPAYQTNTLCVAYGTAGVVHALRRTGRPLPDGVAERLRRDALASAGQLAPGLHVGLSGIAWVLADLGLLAEAADLLAVAGRHPLTGESATLYGGSSGVALTHLALYGHTGDEFHVDQALALAAALPPDDDLVPYLGPNNATGLTRGRCGIALMLQQLSAVTGDGAALARARRLLHAELDRAVDPDAPGLLFPVSETDRRQMSYLFCGSAGMALTVARYLRGAADDRLAEALPRLLASLRLPFCAMPALFTGQAGFAFALAEHAALTGDDASRQDAVRAAGRLFKYAIPHPTGVRFLGSQLLRYSAELWTGSAGIVLALTHALSPRPDMLFTVDALAG